MAKSTIGIIISRVVGFLLFIVLLGVANFIAPHVYNNIYVEIVSFFNSMLYILLIMMLIGMVNELFWNWPFPFSILAPVTSAALSVYVISFIYSLWLLVDSHMNSGISVPITIIKLFVPVIVLILGYIVLSIRVVKPARAFMKTREHEEEERDILAEKEMWEEKAAALAERLERVESRLKEKHSDKAKDVSGKVSSAFRTAGDAISNTFDKIVNKKDEDDEEDEDKNDKKVDKKSGKKRKRK